jgi:hypothetical protein
MNGSYQYQVSAQPVNGGISGSMGPLSNNIPVLERTKMRLIGFGVPTQLANALVPTSLAVLSVSALGGAAGWHIAKKRKSSMAGQIGWTLGSFVLPWIVPSVGAIMMVRK